MPPHKHKNHSSNSPAELVLSAVRKHAKLAGRFWWLLLVLTAFGIAGAYWKNLKQAPEFVSQARMMVGGKIDLPEGAVYSEELSNFYGTQVGLMQSGEIRRRAAGRVESAHPELRSVPVVLSGDQKRGTSVWVLRVTGEDPNYCQALFAPARIPDAT